MQVRLHCVYIWISIDELGFGWGGCLDFTVGTVCLEFECVGEDREIERQRDRQKIVSKMQISNIMSKGEALKKIL